MGFLINYTCHTDCTHTPNQTHKSTDIWKKIEFQIPAVKLQRILLYKETPAYRAPNISIVSCYLTTFVSCCRPNEVASFSLMLSLSHTHTWILRKPKGLPSHPNSNSSSLRHQGNCVSPLPSAFAKFIQHVRYTRNKTRQKYLDKKKETGSLHRLPTTPYPYTFDTFLLSDGFTDSCSSSSSSSTSSAGCQFQIRHTSVIDESGTLLLLLLLDGEYGRRASRGETSGGTSSSSAIVAFVFVIVAHVHVGIASLHSRVVPHHHYITMLFPLHHLPHQRSNIFSMGSRT